MGNIMKQHSILFTLFIPFTVLFILAFAIFMSYFIITESDKAKTDSFIYRDSCPDAPFVNKSHESYRIRGSFFIALKGRILRIREFSMEDQRLKMRSRGYPFP